MSSFLAALREGEAFKAAILDSVLAEAKEHADSTVGSANAEAESLLSHARAEADRLLAPLRHYSAYISNTRLV